MDFHYFSDIEEDEEEKAWAGLRLNTEKRGGKEKYYLNDFFIWICYNSQTLNRKMNSRWLALIAYKCRKIISYNSLRAAHDIPYVSIWHLRLVYRKYNVYGKKMHFLRQNTTHHTGYTV